MFCVFGSVIDYALSPLRLASLVHVLAGEAFRGDFPPTIFETLKQTVMVGNGWKEYPVELWDVSGSERYSKKRPVIYPNINAFVCCFDVNDYFSFTNCVKIWLPEAASSCAGLPVRELARSIPVCVCCCFMDVSVGHSCRAEV